MSAYRINTVSFSLRILIRYEPKYMHIQITQDVRFSYTHFTKFKLLSKQLYYFISASVSRIQSYFKSFLFFSMQFGYFLIFLYKICELKVNSLLASVLRFWGFGQKRGVYTFSGTVEGYSKYEFRDKL